MENTFGSLHYNAIGPYLKRLFGCRIAKLSLDGGFTCPNRDGSKGTGGCTFCNEDGSGRFTGPVAEQMRQLSSKWPEDTKYIAYFQNFTGTYAPVERLRSLWEDALAQPGCVGLAVATRPDCLPEDVLDLLSEFNKKTFLWVELGLQTANEATADRFNRCWKNTDFEDAMRNLSTRGIKTVIHLILGLPGEDKRQVLASAEYAASFHPFGIKLHMLHLMEGTVMGKAYQKDPFPVLSREEYVALVCDVLERLPADITVHRVTGDAPRADLIAPLWTGDKRAVLRAIQQEFKRRGTWQGCLCYNQKD
ncbi:MAG: TIGR01212 family radical SAM protein [Firmicutes bacterium]|nr:TIGR01212 family radical SAM protein [Bacillota bacterium]